MACSRSSGPRRDPFRGTGRAAPGDRVPGTVMHHPGDLIPPGKRTIVEEAAGDEEHGGRVLRAENRIRQFKVVQIAVVERDQHSPGRPPVQDVVDVTHADDVAVMFQKGNLPVKLLLRGAPQGMVKRRQGRISDAVVVEHEQSPPIPDPGEQASQSSVIQCPRQQFPFSHRCTPSCRKVFLQTRIARIRCSRRGRIVRDADDMWDGTRTFALCVVCGL
jgi:hypothetical protein